jgi:lipopolysaccharide cholinephosphotransferase
MKLILKRNIILLIYMNTKIRIRTELELEVRKKEFLKICNILDNIGITYFLNTGILLGAIRDNNFIKWDWDVEISVMSEELYKNFDLICKSIKKNNFQIIQIDDNKESLKIDFFGHFPKETTRYTIFSWNYSFKDNVYWRKDKVIPSEFLKKFSKIIFFGRSFNVPYNPKKFLKFAYGEWMTPIRTSNKAIYMTNNFKKKNFLIKKVLIKIFNYIFKKFFKITK